MWLLLLPGVTSLLDGSAVVLRERSHLLHIHQDTVLRLGVSLHCVGIAGGVTTISTAVGRVCMQTVLVFGEVAALLGLKVTHITVIVTPQLVQHKIMFCLHVFKYFILVSGLVGAMGAVIAAQLMDGHLVSVDDGILLGFKCAAIKITDNILILLQVDVLYVLLQRTLVFGLIFALVTRKADVLVFSFIMLFEARPVTTLVVTLITLVEYPCNRNGLNSKTIK